MLRHRRWNHFRANWGGYFWLPCPTCGQMFGGHEWDIDSQHIAHIPAPGVQQECLGNAGLGICPECTESGKGDEAWAAIVFPNLQVERVPDA